MHTGEDGRVSRSCIRYGMTLMAVLKISSAFQEATETTLAKIGTKSDEVVGAALVDADHDRQVRRSRVVRSSESNGDESDKSNGEAFHFNLQGAFSVFSVKRVAFS